MCVRIIGSYGIKIKDFSLFVIRNHFSLHLLISVHSSSQVKPTHMLFPLPPHGSLTRGATNHMTGNFSLFTMFQSHRSTSTITLADGSTSCVIES